MPNSEKCKTCQKYWPLERGQKKGTKQLTRGYCLARTIFPEGRVGNKVLPPRAKIENTKNDMIISHIVREDDIIAGCNTYVPGRKVA